MTPLQGRHTTSIATRMPARDGFMLSTLARAAAGAHGFGPARALGHLILGFGPGQGVASIVIGRRRSEHDPGDAPVRQHERSTRVTLLDTCAELVDLSLHEVLTVDIATRCFVE